MLAFFYLARPVKGAADDGSTVQPNLEARTNQAGGKAVGNIAS